MNYEMSEHDSDWHGPMSDPNTGGNWREEFRRGLIEIGFGALGTAELERIERLIEKTRRNAYRAGLERAKALVPNNYVALSLLADIDEEIAKSTPSQLSERDTDWCGVPDENSRAKSEEV